MQCDRRGDAGTDMQVRQTRGRWDRRVKTTVIGWELKKKIVNEILTCDSMFFLYLHLKIFVRLPISLHCIVA